jgi:hypothetical protein
MRFFPKFFSVVMLPLAAVLLFGVPQVSAHGDEGNEHFHKKRNDAHRQGHRDLRGLHSEFHEYPSTRKEHKRFHRLLKKEHRQQHRELTDWQKDYRRDRYWDWRTNDDRWGQRNRDGWRRDHRDYERYNREWRLGGN